MSIQVMVNGIPGNMGRIVAETCVARGLELPQASDLIYHKIHIIMHIVI